MAKQFSRGGAAHEPEQCRAAQNFQTGFTQQRIEPRRRLRQPAPCRFDPAGIRKRRRGGRDRGAGNGPRSEPLGEPRGERRRRKRKAEPQTGQAEELTERAQHDDIAA